MASTKKKNVVSMIRAMISTCFLLGTLAVFHGGSGSSSSSSSTANSGGLSEALLLRQNQAAPVYDPRAFCFKDNDNDDKYCWCLTDNFPVDENWIYIGRGYNSCGPACPSPDLPDWSDWN